MALTRQEKEQMLQEYSEKLQRAQVLIWADYRGTTVSQVQDLRGQLRPVGAEAMVVKNTLMRLALEQANLPVPSDIMAGPSAVTFVYDNVAAATKVVTGFALANDRVFHIKGGMAGGKIIDAGQVTTWPTIKECLNDGDALYFSHGFSITFKDQTRIIPPENVDVIMVAPKGSGRTLRTNFIEGSGLNSSFAIHQDYTGRARERTLATGIAIGSAYLFPTTFKNEVYSDLTGERGVLMGCLAGVMEAQYNLLRKHGHTPSEAFNETVEELTQSLILLVAENGMDWMFANCSATAQRGALDWAPKFKDAVTPVFDTLYERVKSGEETQRVLDANSAADYRQQLDKELKVIHDSEMWRTGVTVRSLRPENRRMP